MIKTENFAQVEVTSKRQLRAWLMTHHTQSDSVWLVTYKKHMGQRYVSVQDILDEVLCFGWVDGIRRQLDEARTMQMISPCQTQHWAKTYKDRAAKLIEAGQMQPAGLAAIAESKRNGLWNFMDDVDALIKPDDLIAALETHPPAQENFDAFSPSMLVQEHLPKSNRIHLAFASLAKHTLQYMDRTKRRQKKRRINSC